MEAGVAQINRAVQYRYAHVGINMNPVAKLT
jgi:hypothetical protein